MSALESVPLLNLAGYQQQLRGRVLQKIRDDWPIYFRRHGNEFIDLDAIGSQNGFVEDVAEAVADVLRKRGREDVKKLAPSKYFYRRMFFQYVPEQHWQQEKRQALCIYVGFKSWEDFVSDCRKKDVLEEALFLETQEPAQELPALQPFSTPDNSTRSYKLPRLVWVLIALCIGIGIWLLYWGHRGTPATIIFRIIQVHGKYAPVTLQVQYDIGDITYKHALVQVRGQTGMLIEEIPLREFAGILPITMLHSGVRAIQLMVDGKVIRELPYIVKTNGWLGRTVDHGQSYPAITGQKLRQQGALYISPPVAIQPNADLDYVTFYGNCRSFGVRGDAVIVDFRACNNPKDGGLACHDIGLEMQDARKGQVALNFVIPECIGLANLKINNAILDARNDSPLAVAMGQEVRQWATYRIQIANQRIQAFRDNRLLFQRPCPVPIDTLAHILFTFKGTGRLDWLRLRDATTGRVTYQEDF